MVIILLYLYTLSSEHKNQIMNNRFTIMFQNIFFSDLGVPEPPPLCTPLCTAN